MKSLINKFTRITSTGLYVPEIDGLRFFAILWVFLYHLDDYLIANYHINQAKILRIILGNGHFGVELFFVISGFVLSLPFARYYLKHGKKINVKQYFIRRLTRLEPPYFLIMILLFFINSGTHLH
ncbi:MAG: acyltransferase family protein, partial [Ginsengibacter sp.]